MKLGTRHPALMLVAAFLWPSALAFTVPSIARSRYGATPVKALVEHQFASSAPEKVKVIAADSWALRCCWLLLWGGVVDVVRIYENKTHVELLLAGYSVAC